MNAEVWAGREYVVRSTLERTDVVSLSGVMSKKAVPSDSSHDVLTVFEADMSSCPSQSVFSFGRVGIICLWPVFKDFQPQD